MGRGSFSLIISVVLILGGCASTPTKTFPKHDPNDITREDQVEIEDLLTAESLQVVGADEVKVDTAAIPETTAPSKDEGKFDDVQVPKAKNLALVQTSHAIRVQTIKTSVKKWVTFFTTKDRERFARFIERGARYKDLVSSILKAEGVPPEIFYLGVIESGYVTHAKSHASAVGIWQFIKGTGQRYGLRVNKYVDERRDPVRATRAAARYLRDLYGQFNSWELALAAYNCGEGRIASVIRRAGTRDYWKLAHLGFLPEETQDYVPKFMAAVWIGQHPAQYGFQKTTKEEYPDLVGVEFPSFITLRSIAQVSRLGIESLELVNPHLSRGVIPPTSRSKYVLWVSEDQASKLKTVSHKLAQVLKDRTHRAIAQAKEHVKYTRSHQKSKTRIITMRDRKRARKYN
ncbi:MAG: lytic transglycosylase domain-containing protein [Xanthomonadaceae bacterium]|nr:lytic transglycosylase domain-containing protein [Xanthomonadaceae bacterium]